MDAQKNRREILQCVTKFVWVWCGLLVTSPVIRVNLPRLMKILGRKEGIYDNWVPFGGCVFRQVSGVQRKPLSAFAVQQVSSAQKDQYTKAAYFGVACPSTARECRILFTEEVILKLWGVLFCEGCCIVFTQLQYSLK